MYRLEQRTWLKHLDFMILDIICLEISYVAAYMLRMGIHWPFSKEPYRKLGIIILIIHICVIFFADSYHQIIDRRYPDEIKMILKHNLGLLMGILLYLYTTKQGELYSRIIVFAMCSFNCVFLIVARLGWKRIVRKRRKARRTKRNLLVVTNSKEVSEIVDTLQKDYYADFRILGIMLIDKDCTGEEVSSIPIVASKTEIFQYVKEHIVDEVLISIVDDKEYIEWLMNHLINMGVIVHINLVQLKTERLNSVVGKVGGYTVLTVGIKFASDWQLFVKRLMDIAGALAGLVITGILFLIFAPVIYVQSPGTIFFSQERVGKNGRVFKIYKFRSMYPDAEERKKDLMAQNKMKGAMFKMDNDPRIIPIGRFMRKTSLDEFPQFWNVLKGEMSLVGTRPPTVEEYKQYELHHKQRLASKPGITGLWQISGRSDISDFEEVVALDAKYISNWCLLLDIKILLKTLKVIIKHEGAV